MRYAESEAICKSFSGPPCDVANAGISAVGLANNHIRNAGETGVLETLSNLAAVGLPGAGAGANLADTKKRH